MVSVFLLPGCGGKEQGENGTNGNGGTTASSSSKASEVFSSEPMVKWDDDRSSSSDPASKENNSSAISKNNESADILGSIYDQSESLNLCEGNLNPGVSEEVSEVYSVGNNAYLAEVLCFMAAYQGSYDYVLYKDGQAKRLPFRVFDENGEELQVKNLGGLPTYDPTSKTLEIATKGRGLGDCGSLAQYKFENNNFKLIEYRAKNECDGEYIEPDQYPLVFPGGSNSKSSSSKADNKQNETLPPPMDGDGSRQIDGAYVLGYVKEQQPAIGSCAPQSDDGYEVYRVSAQQYLIQALCATYAYQAEYQFLSYTQDNGDNVEVLSFADFAEDDQGNFNQMEANFLVGMVNYDPTPQTLTVFSKFNGAGTCGSLSSYQWNGTAFTLEQFQAKTDCESDYVEPDQYPIIYP